MNDAIRERPEWVRCVSLDESGNIGSWCGGSYAPFFTGPTHAALNSRNGGRLVTCPECAAAIGKALGIEAALSAAPVGAEWAGDKPPLPVVVRTAPERIYLQISDDSCDYDGPFPGDGVTWCSDNVLDCEVQYVRADLAAAPQQTLTASAEQTQPAQELMPPRST